MTQHTKIIGIIAILLFASSLGLLVGSLLFLQKTDGELNEKRIQIAKIQNNERELTSLTRLVEETAEERVLIDSYLLHEEEVIDFLALIESLGREQNVELQTTSLTVQPLNDVFDQLRINVSVTGPYSSVVHMLKLFETLPYQVTVLKTSLSQASDNSQTSLWNGLFDLQVTKYK